MTDYRNIRDACEAVIKSQQDGYSLLSGERVAAFDWFRRAMSPTVVLELLNEIERLRAQLVGAEFANAAAAAILVEHSEINGHVEVVEQCIDYLDHEITDNGDPTGKLRDLSESLRVVIDQLDRQRRSRNWYEAAYVAGKQKLIESALRKQTEKLATVTVERDYLTVELGRLRKERDSLAAEIERWRHGVQVEGDYVCPLSLELSAVTAALNEACDRWEGWMRQALSGDVDEEELVRIAELRRRAK